MIKDFASRSLVILSALALTTCSSSSHAPHAPVIETQPADQTVVVGQTATFSVVASGSAPLSYQWQRGSAKISGATSASYTTPVVAAGDNGSQFQVSVTNASGSVTSGTATLHVLTAGVDVITYHNDNTRSGLNPNEITLTTANVNSSTFGKVNFYPADGQVNAEPLYLSQVNIPTQGSKNVVYAVTEHDSVYAFDAGTGTVIWKISVLGSGETPSGDFGCSQVTPEIGITATPVIDRARGPNGAMYIIAMSKDSSGQYHQRIHALDIATGAELFGGPKEITASYPGNGDNSTNGNVIFDPKQYNERPGLLLLNGTVYTTWGSHCDFTPYTSWVMGFDANTLAQTQVLNLVPNGSEGGIWMSGTAPAADSSGNIYLLNGNGTFDTTLNAGFPEHGDCGNCFVKLSTSGSLKLADYFAVFNTVQESNSDEDLGSGGALVLPDVVDNGGQVHHLAVGAGKDAHIYVVDRDSMGKFNPSANNNYQDIAGALANSVFAMPAYFNNTVYFGAVGDAIKAFPITNANVATTPAVSTLSTFTYPGTTPSISANGSSNAILWAVENSSPAVLHAYDATNLSHELYNTNQAAGGRDNFGPGNKFITPMIVNGRVYVGTGTGVAVFGLLP